MSFFYMFTLAVCIDIFEADLPVAPDYLALVHIMEQTCGEGPGFLFNEIEPKNVSQECTKSIQIQNGSLNKNRAFSRLSLSH